GLDDAMIEDIVRSVSRTETGALALISTPELDRVVSSFPNFWFYVVDADSKSIGLGEIPPQIRVFPGALLHVSSANLTDLGNPASPYALIRTRDSAVGKLWIMTAGGPPVSWRFLSVAFSNPFFVSLLILLTTVTLL